MADTFLDKAYYARTPEETRDLYDAWAQSYDDEIADNGYASPARCAQALAKFTKDMTAPILDFGCGTGLSGSALKQAGFTNIDGVDLSPDMLDRAAEKQVYANLRTIMPDEKPVTTPGDYSAIAAVGVIGAAPISVFDTLMHSLARAGKLVASINDHALANPETEGRICEWLDCGAARLLFKESGPHLPGIDLNSNVYVFEKT